MSTMTQSGLPPKATAAQIAEASGLTLPAFYYAMRTHGTPPNSKVGRMHVWDRMEQFCALTTIIETANYPKRLNDGAVARCRKLIPLVGRDMKRELNRVVYYDAVRPYVEAEVLGENAAQIQSEVEKRAQPSIDGYLSSANMLIAFKVTDEQIAGARREKQALVDWDAGTHPSEKQTAEERERAVYESYVRSAGRSFEYEPGSLREAMQRDIAALKDERGPKRRSAGRRSISQRVKTARSERAKFDPTSWPKDERKAFLAEEEALAARYAREMGRTLVWRPGNLGLAMMDDIAKVRRGK